MIQRQLYLTKIKNFINQTDLVKVITGIRRSGKSIFLDLIKEELLKQNIKSTQIISLNFEDLDLIEFKDYLKLYHFLKEQLQSKNKRTYLFLDEIQEVDKWEEVVNSLRVKFDVDIYITGSNAKMLVSEFSTKLSGRYVEVQIFPLSFKEIYDYKDNKNIDTLFSQYLKTGGMPMIIANDFNQQMQKQYLNDIFTSVLLKDIVKRNQIRDIDLLERLIKYILANMGKTFSANSIAKFFKQEQRKVAPETILNYLQYCKQAYLLIPLSRFDVPSKRLLKIDDKFYISDHGIREVVYGNNERDIELSLENIVCLELLRRDYQLTIGKVGDKEIDFIATKGAYKIYIQVSYLLASQETIEREFSVYEKIPDNFPKFVLSMDKLDFSQNGIIHMNIEDWLLKE